MKKLFLIACLPILFSTCKKDKKADPEPDPAPSDTYSSLNDFFEKNGVQKQTFTFDVATGGSFVTPQSTTINIPPNALDATGNITLEFKDIYQKSDMVLSDMPTILSDGKPLTSGGEIFIRALSNGTPVNIVKGKQLEIRLPMVSLPTASMTPFVGTTYSVGTSNVWTPSQTQTITPVVQPTLNANYIGYYNLQMSEFSSPLSNGTWVNCDHPHFPSSQPQSQFKVKVGNAFSSPQVYLVFKSSKTVVPIYMDQTSTFVYAYAPINYDCTVIAINLRDGKLYSAIAPTKIAADQTFNVDLKQTTTEDFKTALKSLN